jgi:hypothetical protein
MNRKLALGLVGALAFGAAVGVVFWMHNHPEFLLLVNDLMWACFGS